MISCPSHPSPIDEIDAALDTIQQTRERVLARQAGAERSLQLAELADVEATWWAQLSEHSHTRVHWRAALAAREHAQRTARHHRPHRPPPPAPGSPAAAGPTHHRASHGGSGSLMTHLNTGYGHDPGRAGLLMTVEEVAELWFGEVGDGGSASSNCQKIRRLIPNTLPARRIGNRWYIHRATAESWASGCDPASVMSHPDTVRVS